MLKEFLFLQKEQQQAPGNAINFIAQMAEGCVDPQLFAEGTIQVDHTTDRAMKFAREALENIASLVVEHPIAESVREDHREYTWVDGELLLSATPFRQILQEAIASSQKADFELPRYEANIENYEKLVQGRTAGDNRLFVEFSPSPRLTSQAHDRGYRGNSYIGVFQMVGGVEQFTQYWFRASWDEIGDLIRNLGKPLQDEATDIDILRASDFISEKDLEGIQVFIEKKRGAVAQNRQQILQYIEDELRPSLDRQLRELLKDAAEKLLRNESVERESTLIINTLRYAQNKMNQFIATVGEVPIRFVQLSKEQEQLYDANPLIRSLFVEKENLPLVGCGSSVSNDKSDPFGINDSRESDEFGPLEFECPNPHCKKIVRRPKGKLLEKCPHCGASVRC